MEKKYSKVGIVGLNCGKYVITTEDHKILFKDIDSEEEAIKKANEISDSYFCGNKMDIDL